MNSSAVNTGRRRSSPVTTRSQSRLRPAKRWKERALAGGYARRSARSATMEDLCPDRLLSKNHCRSRTVAQAIGKAIDPAARSKPKLQVELLSQKHPSQSTRS